MTTTDDDRRQLPLLVWSPTLCVVGPVISLRLPYRVVRCVRTLVKSCRASEKLTISHLINCLSATCMYDSGSGFEHGARHSDESFTTRRGGPIRSKEGAHAHVGRKDAAPQEAARAAHRQQRQQQQLGQKRISKLGTVMRRPSVGAVEPRARAGSSTERTTHAPSTPLC